MDKKNDKRNVVNNNHMENCNVFMGDIYGAIIPLPGTPVTINQHYGKDTPPWAARQQQADTDGTPPWAADKQQPQPHDTPQPAPGARQEHRARKEKAMADILSNFRFEDKMLAYDGRGKKITNERLRYLLRLCLGMTDIKPSETFRNIQEQLWTMLIDKRTRCTKVNGEDFYRQTLLNVVGYFISSRLLGGKPLDVAKCIFPDFDSKSDGGMLKNLSRGITDNFPEGTTTLLDHYIKKLMDGEI